MLGCQTAKKKAVVKTITGSAYLKFYESEIPLENGFQKTTEGRSAVTSKFYQGAKQAELTKYHEAFKNSFKDITDKKTKKILRYSECLVDSQNSERIFFYYGDTVNPTDCLKSEYRTVGLRLWKLCPNGLYEVTIGPIDVTDGIEIICTASKPQ
jgi:hypothetical protein